jgi:type I restriction enzyme, S subunit
MVSKLSFDVFEVPQLWITEAENPEQRLDASYFSKDTTAAKLIMDSLRERGITVGLVKDWSNKLFWPSRFKRAYMPDIGGKPFLMPSEVIRFYPRAKKYIKNPPSELAIDKNWLLITRSGSIGRVAIATKMLAKFILSDDLIRLEPNDLEKLGYLYIYLNTWLGQAFLIKDQYGATVKHIEPHHVGNIPLPVLPDIEEYIANQVREIYRLREEAQGNLLKAEELLASKIELVNIKEKETDYLPGLSSKTVKAFQVNSIDLNSRLDGSYHFPLARTVVSQLKSIQAKGLGEISRLGDLCNSFAPPRFKRAYVKDPLVGLPLLQGTHISQMKPYDIKYLWKKMRGIDKYIIQKNWILVTCSGTIGKVSLVSSYWDGLTATNHLLRVIPNSNGINPGYLALYLLSVYGQAQFQRIVYGGVVDEIGEAGELFNEILVLRPKDSGLEDEIGNLVLDAYEKRDQATKLEEETIKFLEDRLDQEAKSLS